ncbi:MAG: tetratricopeptide repeat protein [Promethearchaeota archaeon]|jgi:tetratricopeptide (TPR) repeat protein
MELGALGKILEQHENLFNSLPEENSVEYQERKACWLIMKGAGNYNRGNLDLALDDHEKSLALLEKIDSHSRFIYRYIPNVWMAVIYQLKGDLKLALECAEKALSLTNKGEFYTFGKGNIYRTMGRIYYQKGDLNRALEYQTRALTTYKKIKGTWGGVGFTYSRIIEVLLAKKDLTQAWNYIEEFKQFKENYEPKTDFMVALYRLSRALILKASSRMRDHVEAEYLLKKIVEQNTSIYITNSALIGLCDWYFEEFRISNQMEILDDIQPLINQLQRNAKHLNSYSLLANMKLLQAKLCLLQVNMIGARKLLTEAQDIANEHGLQFLAGEISIEHDRLLEELKLWESFKKKQVTIPERLKLASIDDVLERMQGRRAIEVPEVSIEEPILLLIMDKNGVSYFNHSFIDNWDFDDLFSAFMVRLTHLARKYFPNRLTELKSERILFLLTPLSLFWRVMS